MVPGTEVSVGDAGDQMAPGIAYNKLRKRPLQAFAYSFIFPGLGFLYTGDTTYSALFSIVLFDLYANVITNRNSTDKLDHFDRETLFAYTLGAALISANSAIRYNRILAVKTGLKPGTIKKVGRQREQPPDEKRTPGDSQPGDASAADRDGHPKHRRSLLRRQSPHPYRKTPLRFGIKCSWANFGKKTPPPSG